ncbi:MAG: XRE family transcriptional regulator [Desulfobacteraceae bacterium]|nr:MAG: XRE family transcriptional regulator [Desulfobacteraceae bacterium]
MVESPQTRENVFGDNLALLMRFFKVRQRQLAQLIQVGQDTISWWKTGKSVPHRDRRHDVVEIFLQRAPRLNINADSIVLVRLTEEDIKRALVEPSSTLAAAASSGLDELAADRTMVELLGISEQEWQMLRGISWPKYYQPSKRIFIEILHDYRKGAEK